MPGKYDELLKELEQLVLDAEVTPRTTRIGEMIGELRRLVAAGQEDNHDGCITPIRQPSPPLVSQATSPEASDVSAPTSPIVPVPANLLPANACAMCGRLGVTSPEGMRKHVIKWHFKGSLQCPLMTTNACNEALKKKEMKAHLLQTHKMDWKSSPFYLNVDYKNKVLAYDKQQQVAIAECFSQTSLRSQGEVSATSSAASTPTRTLGTN